MTAAADLARNPRRAERPYTAFATRMPIVSSVVPFNFDPFMFSPSRENSTCRTRCSERPIQHCYAASQIHCHSDDDKKPKRPPVSVSQAHVYARRDTSQV